MSTAARGPNWSFVTLGELTKNRPICYGVLKPGPNDPRGVPLVRVTDIAGNNYDASKLVRITNELDQEFRRSRLRGGEILISIQGTIGRVAIYPEDSGGANVSRTIAVVDPDERVNRRFAYWYLRGQGERGLFETVGSTRSSLNIGVLRRVSIPIPPLEEQKWIAAVLDRADALRAKRRAATKKLEALKQAIFMDMFGNPSANPDEWGVVTVGDLCHVKGGKRLPKGAEYSPISTEHRYIRVVDLHEGKVAEENLVYLTPEVQQKISRYTVSEEDIIVSIAGSIGEVAWVPSSLSGANLTENAAKLAPRASSSYDARYLAAFLRLPDAQRQIERQTGQVTIGKLALFRLAKVRVLLPPLALQTEYVRRIELVDGVAARLAESEALANRLFGSLQSRAFAEVL